MSINENLRALIREILTEESHANGTTWRTKSGKIASKNKDGKVRYHSGKNSKGAAKYHASQSTSSGWEGYHEAGRDRESTPSGGLGAQQQVEGAEIDEVSASGAAGPYMTPKAFGKRKPASGVSKQEEPHEFGDTKKLGSK
jgi:hypothetical protein